MDEPPEPSLPSPPRGPDDKPVPHHNSDRVPSGLAGPAMFVFSVGWMVAAVTVVPSLGPFLAPTSFLLLLASILETGRAVDTWFLRRRARRHEGLRVVRRLLRVASLEVPALGEGATASRGYRDVALLNARVWDVRVPVRADFDVKIEKRGLLTRGPGLGDPAFDEQLVATSEELDVTALAWRIGPQARAALVRLFLQDAILVDVTPGSMHVRLARRGDDPAAVAAALPSIRVLADELGRKPTSLPPLGALRGHSPAGHPVGG